jgi:hypothetical protein
MILTPKLHAVSVRCEGTQVVVLVGGRAVLNMPYQAAFEVARAIILKAQKAEEEAKKMQIAGDQAILQRKGIPVGFSNRMDIQQEAMKQAHYDPKLRKYLPGGVKSEEVFGTPSVIKHPPKVGSKKNGSDNTH